MLLDWKPGRLRRAPRTVVGYHGCSRATAEQITAGEPFVPSTRRYDWLGVGIYFWEYGPFRAREWAEIRFGSEAAVLEATIRPGRCLNRLDIEHHATIADAFERTVQQAAQDGTAIPENTANGRHYRDRHIIEFYCRSAVEDLSVEFQIVRACYPEGEPLFPGSRLLSRTHVQIAVRDHRCITRLRWVKQQRRSVPTHGEYKMKQRRRVPTDQEVHEAFLRRIEAMTREDWLRSIEELSHAPEGVEDPWPPYDGPSANGAAPAPPAELRPTPDPQPTPEPKR